MRAQSFRPEGRGIHDPILPRTSDTAQSPSKYRRSPFDRLGGHPKTSDLSRSAGLSVRYDRPMAVTDEAIQRIKDMIISGELAPGQRLPPEKELGERLGLSRSSLREAVKALEVIRVLDVRRGDGTYVTSLEPHLLLEAMSFVVDLHTDRSVLEILAVRRILEPAAAALAARGIRPDQTTALEHIVNAPGPHLSIEELVQHDLAFHQAIVEATGNEYLSRLMQSMSSATVRARIWRGITERGAAERTLAEHAAILDALTRHDAELAAALMLAHVVGVESWLRDASQSTASEITDSEPTASDVAS
jgi:GntR family transcriptional repressor for pyruvate dehydrogenase complex